MPQLRACSRCGNPTADTDFSAGCGVCLRCERARNNARYAKRRDKLIAYVLSKRDYKAFHKHWRSTPERLQKTRARNAVVYAVQSGRIRKPVNCQRCYEVAKLNGHHADYSKPYEVEWLCTTCHGMEHRK